MSECYIAYIPKAGESDQKIVVKIGHSSQPAFRFQQLCAMGWLQPGWLETVSETSVSGREIEAFLHEQLCWSRVHHEWFHVSREELNDARQDVLRRFGGVWKVVEDAS